MRFSRKDLWERPLSTGVNLHDIYKKPTRFLRMSYQGKHHQLGLKWTTTKKTKKASWSPKLSRGGNRLISLLSGIHMITFYKKKKKKVTQEVEPQDKRVEPQVQTAELECEPTVPRAWNLITFAWLGFEIGISGSAFVFFSPFLTRGVCHCYPMPVLLLPFQNS